MVGGFEQKEAKRTKGGLPSSLPSFPSVDCRARSTVGRGFVFMARGGLHLSLRGAAGYWWESPELEWRFLTDGPWIAEQIAGLNRILRLCFAAGFLLVHGFSAGESAGSFDDMMSLTDRAHQGGTLRVTGRLSSSSRRCVGVIGL